MKFRSQNPPTLFCMKKVVMGLCAALLFTSALCRTQDKNPAPREIFQRAREAEHRGDYAEAEKLYRRVLTIDPSLFAARVNLGLACYYQHKNNEAVFELQQVLHTHPREFSSLLFSGLAYTELGQYDHARKLLGEALQINDLDPQVFSGLGNLAMAQGDTNAAVPFLERSLAFDPNNVRTMWTLGQAYALLAYRDDRKPNVPADYRALVEKMFHSVEERQPDSALLHVFKGDVMVACKLATKAIEEYRRALEIDPQWPDIHLLIGSLLAAQGRWDEAITELNLHMRDHPEDMRAKVKIGKIYCHTANYRGAVPVLEEVLSRDTNNYDANYQLAQAYVNLGQHALAVPLLERTIKLKPRESEPYYLLYRAYRGLKEPEKAAGALKRFNQLKATGS